MREVTIAITNEHGQTRVHRLSLAQGGIARAAHIAADEAIGLAESRTSGEPWGRTRQIEIAVVDTNVPDSHRPKTP